MRLKHENKLYSDWKVITQNFLVSKINAVPVRGRIHVMNRIKGYGKPINRKWSGITVLSLPKGRQLLCS